jgi:uncharacterized membrane protein
MDERAPDLRVSYAIAFSAIGLAILALFAFALMPWWPHDPLGLVVEFLAGVL